MFQHIALPQSILYMGCDSDVILSVYNSFRRHDVVTRILCFKHCIHTRIANISTGENSSVCISAKEIWVCISMLKLHKNDGGTGLNANYFIYANTDLHFHVAFLLSAFVCHGSVPDDFLLCTTIPLPKVNILIGLFLVIIEALLSVRFLVDWLMYWFR